MSRLDLLPENQLAARLAAIERDLLEMKAPQRASRESLLVRRLPADDLTFGLDYSLPISSPDTYRWRLKFTPDRAVRVFAEVQGFVTADGGNYMDAMVYPDPDNITDDAFRSWIIAITPYSTPTVARICLSVVSIDTGELELTAL